MKLLCISDVHFEFEPCPKNPLDWEFFKLLDKMADADVLILAGDIHTKGRAIFANIAASYYPHVLYVCGNHEFYKGNIDKIPGKIRADIKSDNIHLLTEQTIEIDGIRFHGTTLWTSLYNADPQAMLSVQFGMNDCRLIRQGPEYLPFFPAKWLGEHKKAMDFLEEAVQPGDVVITHHAPAMACVQSKYFNDPLNAGYVSALETFIHRTKPALWFHGHMHESIDLTIGQTRVICNARGYHGDRNPNFDPQKVVEI